MSIAAETKQQVDDLTSQSFDYLQLKHEADTAETVYQDLFAKIKQETREHLKRPMKYTSCL